MTTEIPDEFLAAFEQMWLLLPGMDSTAIMQSPAFINLQRAIDTHCYAQIGGIFGLFALRQGLQKLGVPCFFGTDSPLAAPDMVTTAIQCYEALMQHSARETYLCPLDWAGNIPNIKFGNAAIRNYTASELDILLNTLQVRRQSGDKPVDTADLSRFTWLVVETDVELPASFTQRYMGDFPLNITEYGTILPYRNHYPVAVDKALFMLMQAPWEEWMDAEYYNEWRPFDVPWVHTLYSDTFEWQRPIPPANTLTWHPAFFDIDGECLEKDVPAERNVTITADDLNTFVDIRTQKCLTQAIESGLINTAAQHQFVKAFMSTGIDEFLAHIVVIDACVGEKSSKGITQKKFKDLRATGRLKYRLAGLLDDRSVRDVMTVLYDARSDYVHGNALEKIEGEKIIQARTLARKTLNAILIIAGQSPTLTREALLGEILEKGWQLIEGK